MKISLILPVYNPAEGWADNVLAKVNELKGHYRAVDFETIVVNDGSESQSYNTGKEILSNSNIKLIEYNTNKGKGEALRTGVRATKGELVVYTDIDFPYTVESIAKVIDTLKAGETDVVVGVKDGVYYQQVPAVRRFISKLFRFFVRLLLRIPTDDTQCGLKGFNEKGKTIFLQTTIERYLFDLEFIFLASRKAGVAIKIQPVSLRPDVQFREMNFGILRSEAINFFKILIR